MLNEEWGGVHGYDPEWEAEATTGDGGVQDPGKVRRVFKYDTLPPATAKNTRFGTRQQH